jgi:hypothetical protein
MGESMSVFASIALSRGELFTLRERDVVMSSKIPSICAANVFLGGIFIGNGAAGSFGWLGCCLVAGGCVGWKIVSVVVETSRCTRVSGFISVWLSRAPQKAQLWGWVVT